MAVAVLPLAIRPSPCEHGESERDEPEDIDEHVFPERTIVVSELSRAGPESLFRRPEMGGNGEVVSGIDAAPADRTGSFRKIVADDGALPRDSISPGESAFGKKESDSRSPRQGVSPEGEFPRIIHAGSRLSDRREKATPELVLAGTPSTNRVRAFLSERTTMDRVTSFCSPPAPVSRDRRWKVRSSFRIRRISSDRHWPRKKSSRPCAS